MAASLPATHRAWRRSVGKEPLTIEMTTDEATPNPLSLGDQEVLVRIHAVSLNFRDVAMLYGRYIKPVEEHGVTGSDCAAEVVAVGHNVDNFKPGDRVTSVYDHNNMTGEDRGEMAALGGEKPGVLREYHVFDQSVLVHLPKHLSWKESSTLTCAGVTAWTSLRLPDSAHKDKVALLQGTGGVSMFCLLLCLKAGIHPIITSSSDKKIEDIKKLAAPGRIDAINYKTQDVVKEALRLTNGLGVDIVVNNIGAASVNDDLAMLRRRGTISLVGFLAGDTGELSPTLITEIIVKAATITGIYVGSVQDFRNMNKFIEEHGIDLHPLLDKTFKFEDAREAFDYLYSGKHVGKIIVEVQSCEDR